MEEKSPELENRSYTKLVIVRRFCLPWAEASLGGSNLNLGGVGAVVADGLSKKVKGKK